MNRRLFLAAAAASMILPAGRAFAMAPDAATVVAEASTKAAASGRPLLLVFHASWCGYCQVFDMMLADRSAGPIMERYLAAFHLRALEKEPGPRAQQLAGADELFNSYAPPGAGLPYMAVLDEKAGKITDSIMPNGDNFGYPVTPPELRAFEAMMKRAAPAITADELKTLRRVAVKLMDKD